MAISHVASTSGMATPAGGGTFSVTKPTGAADGDVAYIFCSGSDGINGLSSPGWTQLFNVPESGDDSGLWVGRRVLSGEGASWTLTSSGGENIAWWCVVFRGVDNTTPEGATACSSKASASAQVCGPITVTDPGAWFLCAAECDLTGSPTYSGPGGAFVFDGYSVHSTAKNLVGVGYEDLGGSTGSKSRTLTCSTADVYVAAAIELLPAAGGQSVNVPVAAETDTAQAITAKKQVAGPTASETDAAQTLTATKKAAMPVASEAETAQALTALKRVTLPVAVETDVAQTITRLDSAQHVTLPVAVETDAAQALTAHKAATPPVASETDAAQSLTARKLVTSPAAAEADGAQALTARKLVPLPSATGTDTAVSLTVVKRVTLPVAVETSTARPLTARRLVSLTPAFETDTAVALSLTGGPVPLPVASEGDAAQALIAVKRVTLPVAVETSTAQGLTATRRASLVPAVETDVAVALTWSPPGAVTIASAEATDRTLYSLNLTEAAPSVDLTDEAAGSVVLTEEPL